MFSFLNMFSCTCFFARRFVRHSKHVGGGMNTLKDVIHVGDEGDPNKSFESRRIVHHAVSPKEQHKLTGNQPLRSVLSR